MYSPLRHWNAGPGKRVGIIGLGGLGHAGVKIAKYVDGLWHSRTLKLTNLQGTRRRGHSPLAVAQQEGARPQAWC